MGEDLKRNGASAVSLKQYSDDRKLSLAASPSKRVIIKSADMKDDMQKEAIDIAIAASENHSVKKKTLQSISRRSLIRSIGLPGIALLVAILVHM